MTDPLSAAAASAARLNQLTGRAAHDVAVVLGSGWGAAADALGPPRVEISLADVGGFGTPTVEGHVPAVRSVDVGASSVLVFLGRLHPYEGHALETVVHPVRTAVLAGCRIVVLTNASGAVNPAYAVGQAVMIRDHLNLTGRSPLTGDAPPVGFPSRFVDLTDLYAARIRALAPDLAQGVYAGLPGPHFETPAEILMLRTLGADLVGMSTVHEAIAAHHLGAEVVGIALVTNAAAAVGAGPVSHTEVMAAGQSSAPAMGELVARLIISSAKAGQAAKRVET